ncbi:MAG: phospholipase D-like domain-containing protein [Wenzhouxiangellaceae bacterium]|nr:phospholipase D-like domain-containing protein [Wenzhouxiangellaceae bacterium]
MPETLFDASLIVLMFHAVIAPGTALHATLYKRDSRAAFGWIALCVVLPIAGPLIYLVFGINRIRRRARRLDRPNTGADSTPGFERGRRRDPAAAARAADRFGRIGAALGGPPVAGGNRVRALSGGDEAYPAMLEAIAGARRSVFLSSYIFDSDRTGREFVEALAGARERGVDVRVIVDGVGQYYSLPRIPRLLRGAGIDCAVFLPPRLLPPRLSINLRNHHKILVVDGHTAFTGGMNIGNRHVLGDAPGGNKVADLQFELAGPVAGQLEDEFLRTWEFATGEDRAPPPVSVPRAGNSRCRTLTDGPDENMDRITHLLAALVAEARHSVLIMTPYFVPPRELVGALQAAGLRGLEVKLVLPKRNNLPYVHWATRNMLWEILSQGVEVRYQPPPFNHSKLVVVDERYTLVGSSNWDPRSLRLNFELQVEIFDRDFAAKAAQRVRRAAAAGRTVTLAEVDGRSLPVRLRDSLCWLFSPYL